MMQAFVVVLREGFESFLIVAIILAYLRKMNLAALIPAVYWGIGTSVLSSTALGFMVSNGAANQPLLEGWAALIAAVLVTWLVIHMWQTAPTMKKDMENRLTQVTVNQPGAAAFWGVFLFTALNISREGMETALLLIQIHQSEIVAGAALGLAAAGLMAFLWVKFSRFINLKLFFQVTAIFLLLFVGQILIYAFHEFTEAGVLPNSEYLHRVSEPFSPDGLYGKWFSVGMIVICVLWFCGAWLSSKLQPSSSVRTSR